MKATTTETKPTLSERDAKRIETLRSHANNLQQLENNRLAAVQEKQDFEKNLAQKLKELKHLRNHWMDVEEAAPEFCRIDAETQLLQWRLEDLAKAIPKKENRFPRLLEDATIQFAKTRNDVHRERFVLEDRKISVRITDEQIPEVESKSEGIVRLKRFHGRLDTAQDFAELISRFEEELLTDSQERTAVSIEEANGWRWRVATHLPIQNLGPLQPQRPMNVTGPNVIDPYENSIDLGAFNRAGVEPKQPETHPSHHQGENSVDFSKSQRRAAVNEQGEDVD